MTRRKRSRRKSKPVSLVLDRQDCRHGQVLHAPRARVRSGSIWVWLPHRRLCLECGLEESADTARSFRLLTGSVRRVDAETMRLERNQVLSGALGVINSVDSRRYSWPRGRARGPRATT